MTLKTNDTSAKGVIEEFDGWGDKWSTKTTPTLIYNSDLVRSATMFGKGTESFTKSEISVGESKTVEYPVYNGVVVSGFSNTILKDWYEIFSADYTEIPREVIEKFENIVNEATKNLKY